MITCPSCHATQQPRKDGFFKGAQRFLCRKCGYKFTTRTMHLSVAVAPNEKTKPCAVCAEATSNPKFCSTSCAAKYNNAHFPKPKRTRYCKHCGIVIPAGRTVCDACNPSMVDWNERTLQSVREAAKYQANAKVRDIARYKYEKAQLPRVCANCGYDKHVEICHVKAINSFPAETPVAVINDLANLVALCPNCHWELDHGLLRLTP